MSRRREDAADEQLQRLWTYFEEGEPSAAGAADLARAVEAALGPRAPVTRLAQGLAALHAGRFAEALGPLREAARRDPTGVSDWYHAAVLERLERLPEADAAYGRAARRDPQLFHPPTRVSDDTFDRVVEEALAELTPRVRAVLDTTCVVERVDAPSERQVQDGTDPFLLGECVGSAADARAYFESPVGPNPVGVVLYRRNLERIAADEEELAEEVRVTLFHEVGHALGFDEDGVADLGLA